MIKPILTEEAWKAGFTNEGGVGGKIRFHRISQVCGCYKKLMAQWKERGEVLEYEELIAEAELSSISSLIDVDDKRFRIPEIWKMKFLLVVGKMEVRPGFKRRFLKAMRVAIIGSSDIEKQ